MPARGGIEVANRLQSRTHGKSNLKINDFQGGRQYIYERKMTKTILERDKTRLKKKQLKKRSSQKTVKETGKETKY